MRYQALLVDDEDIIRKGLQVIIPWRSLGIEKLFIACSGEEALKIMKIEKIDFMLTDICMLHMNGLELIEKVNEIQPKMRIVVLTGYDSFEYARQCCKMNVHDYLLKPIDEVQLERVVREQLAVLGKEEEAALYKKTLDRAVGMTEQFRVEQLMQHVISTQKTQTDIEEAEKEYPAHKNQKMQAAVLLPTTENQKKWQEEQAYLYLSVKHICISLFDAGSQGITFEDSFGRITLIIFADTKYDEIEERVINLKNVLRGELELSLNILMGSMVQGFKEISLSYHDALTMLKLSKEKKNEILQPKKAEMRLKLFREVVSEIQKSMEEQADDLEMVLKGFDTFLKSSQAYALSESMMKRITFSIISKIYYESVLMGNTSADEGLSNFMNTLITSNYEETVLLARNFIIQLYSREQGRMHELVYEAKKYIKEHLSEDISVTLLAEKMYVTTKYFSRLFKKETGEGCNEYIVRKRMEKAKVMLETTQIRSGEIAGMAGYKDINYFSISFKRYTGMSPKDYRESFR